MEIYAVGGAVRDELLGLPVKDRDWVVVGATPEQMVSRGYRPVGKDFPVFLHPQSNEEYALARSERKTAPGYKGFVFHTAADVTLEQDLARRDLTINAIAKAADGSLIDPYNGQGDISARIFRHVSPAFVEDPVRLLRVARFAARFPEFTLATETLMLLTQMVNDGEVDHLVPERIWQELSRGLMEVRPSRMFDLLRECGALVRILPELDALWGIPQRADYHPEVDTGIHIMMVIEAAACLGGSLAVRFAALTHDFGKALTPQDILPAHHDHEQRSVGLIEQLCERLRVPSDCRDLARIVARHHGEIHRHAELRPDTVVKILTSCDAFRRPDRFDEVLLACEADSKGRLGMGEIVYLPTIGWKRDLVAASNINAKAISQEAASTGKPETIADRINAARVAAVARLREK